MHEPNHSLSLPDEAATRAFAARLASCLQPGLVIYLQGDLGAGKTTLVRALLNALGYQGRVKSPSYTLVELYDIDTLHLRHFDLYRFQDAEEWESAGFRDEFNTDNICLVEWPERAHDLLPPADLRLTLAIAGTGRSLTLTAGSPTGERCLAAL